MHDSLRSISEERIPILPLSGADPPPLFSRLVLLAWELTFHLALEELGFRVERGARIFRILDGESRGQQFDFARGGPAEKVL